jgi:hypothetical protein
MGKPTSWWWTMPRRSRLRTDSRRPETIRCGGSKNLWRKRLMSIGGYVGMSAFHPPCVSRVAERKKPNLSSPPSTRTSAVVRHLKNL